MQPMDTKIQSVIKMFHYPMWFVKLNKKISCPCVNHSTKDPKIGCPICLGTGYKVRLIRAKAARQTTETVSIRGESIGFSEKNAADRFFTLDNLELKPNDIIVDGDRISIVQHYLPGRTDASNPVYYRTIASPMKMNLEEFKKAFVELLRRKGYG